MHWSIPGDADNTTENVSFQINMYQKGAVTRPITWCFKVPVALKETLKGHCSDVHYVRADKWYNLIDSI